MIINYDIQKIDQMLLDFYNATGISMDLLKADFSFVAHRFWEKNLYCKAVQQTEEGKNGCLRSDMELFRRSQQSKKAEMHICHAGLIDVSVPILYNDVIIGYIVFGQMKTDTDFSVLQDYLVSLGLSEEEMKKYYSKIPFFDVDKIQSISNLAEILVKHLLLENMLQLKFDEDLQQAISYIEENLDTDLTIQNIAKNANLSKSVLYRRFHSYFNCTVSQYINKKRIEKSIMLLEKSDLSIDEIAQKVGFSNGSYFSKIFKKEKGIPPLRYKLEKKSSL